MRLRIVTALLVALLIGFFIGYTATVMAVSHCINTGESFTGDLNDGCD